MTLSSWAPFTIDASFLTSGGDILIPVIVEAASDIGAFGFDLAFPSDKWIFLGVEGSDLTAGYEQLSGNVIPYQAAGRGGEQFLRVGGYRTSDDPGDSSGVLVTLVFRARGGIAAPGQISILGAYDDIRNASISVANGRKKKDDGRRFNQKRPVDRGKGRVLGRTSSD
jgi:hypothetical protein